MSEKTEKYFQENLEKSHGIINISRQKIESLQFQKDEYIKQIENSKNEIDMAYDVFSAKPIKNQFYRDQIKHFQEQVDRIDLELEQEYCKLSDAESEIKILEECLRELEQSKVDLEEKQKESELEQGKFVNVKKEELESLVYKCENSKSFLNVDKDRSIMEIDEVVRCLRKLIGSI